MIFQVSHWSPAGFTSSEKQQLRSGRGRARREVIVARSDCDWACDEGSPRRLEKCSTFPGWSKFRRCSNHWIGFLGKIYRKHQVFTMKYMGFPVNYPLNQSNDPRFFKDFPIFSKDVQKKIRDCPRILQDFPGVLSLFGSVVLTKSPAILVGRYDVCSLCQRLVSPY